MIWMTLPLFAAAQKLSEAAMADISEKMAAKFQLGNDSVMVFVTEQMNRSGAGGLEIDKTMMDLKKEPAALDAALKYLYQFSDCNRQTLIAHLRAMDVRSANVFPIATYTVNNFKDEAKTLQEEKAEMVRTGAIPKVSTVMVAPPKAAVPVVTQQTGSADSPATSSTPTPTPTPTTATAPATEDTRNWEVRSVFAVNTPAQLEALYGKGNIEERDAQDLQGQSTGDKAWVVYPDTDNEMEIIFYGDTSKSILFTKENSKWKPPFGIKPGDPIEKVVKLNTRNFRLNGFEWTNGGLVDSWEGGAIDKKGVSVVFKAINTGDPKLYDQVTGDKKVSSGHAAMKKLGVIVDKVVFTTYQ